MTTAEMLARLNDLRVPAGMRPMKVWKGSRVALEAAIEALAIEDHLEELAEAIAKDEEVEEPKSLADWCRENGINPKVARAKLRRAGAPRELSDATIAILGRMRPPVTSVS